MEDLFDGIGKILGRTKGAVDEFMGIITPVIENAKDDHERLYWHHIYEEEEHRLDRLNALLPKIDSYQQKPLDPEQGEFIRLLQDVSLEKFGLHNFLEHLDLSLFSFQDTEHQDSIKKMRDMTAADYQEIKQMMQFLNDRYEGASLNAAIPTDEKEHAGEHVKIEKYANSPEVIETANSRSFSVKRLTVGSLKQN